MPLNIDDSAQYIQKQVKNLKWNFFLFPKKLSKFPVITLNSPWEESKLLFKCVKQKINENPSHTFWLHAFLNKQRFFQLSLSVA